MNDDQQRQRVAPATHDHVGPIYQIRLQGHLDTRWSGWLGGLRIIHEETGTTRLVGPVADQAALHGLLVKIRDLGLTLVSVQRVECE